MKYPDDYINQVIQGDCLDVMRNIPDKSIDMILSDPPYGVNIDDWDIAPRDEFYKEVMRITSGTVVMFSGASMRSVKEFIRYNPDRMLIWAPKFTLSHLCTNGMAWRYHCIWCWGLPKKQDSIKWDILSDNTECGNWWKHSCSKPLSLMEKLVSIVPENSLILDPFIGSGTTAVACVKLKRRFIGIEISEKYCEIAKNRLQNEVEPLFKSEEILKGGDYENISMGKF